VIVKVQIPSSFNGIRILLLDLVYWETAVRAGLRLFWITTFVSF